MAKANRSTTTKPITGRADDGEPEKRPTIASSVFVEVATGGKRPGQDLMPLHEIPLLERKTSALQSTIETINLSVSHGPGKKKPREAQAYVRGHDLGEIEEIFARLNARYTFLPEGAKEGDEVNLVESIYGTGKEGVKALAITMRKLHAAFDDFMDSMGDREPAKKDFLAFIAKNGPYAALGEEIESEILASK
jgi:hypothetical protein